MGPGRGQEGLFRDFQYSPCFQSHTSPSLLWFLASLNPKHFWGSLGGIAYFWSASRALCVSTFFISLLIFQLDLGKQQK